VVLKLRDPRPGSETTPKKHEAKGDAPGLKSSDVSLVSGSKRVQLGTIQNNLGKFLLLNPDFFFLASASVPFLGGGAYDLFFFPNFFFISE
jgi:hypothetical protein